MHFMNLNNFYDFMHVLNSIRKHPTKNEYFLMHILFTKIYLFEEHKLNPENPFEQKNIMIYFLQPTEHNMNMHANLQCMNMTGYL
jgi:hypothetical protein